MAYLPAALSREAYSLEASIDQDQTLHPSGLLRSQPHGDVAAHRHATDVDRVDTQPVEQDDHVSGVLSQ
jgi:hypothetical protein